jgi:hypothetical protein
MRNYPKPLEKDLAGEGHLMWPEGLYDTKEDALHKKAMRRNMEQYPSWGDDPDDTLPLSAFGEDKLRCSVAATRFRTYFGHILLMPGIGSERKLFRELGLSELCTQREMEIAYKAALSMHPDSKRKIFDINKKQFDLLLSRDYRQDFILAVETYFPGAADPRLEDFLSQNPDFILRPEQFEVLKDSILRDRFLQRIREAISVMNPEDEVMTPYKKEAAYEIFKGKNTDLVAHDYSLRIQLFRLMLDPLYRERYIDCYRFFNKATVDWHRFERVLSEIEAGDAPMGSFPIALRYPSLLEIYKTHCRALKSIEPEAVPIAVPVLAQAPETTPRPVSAPVPVPRPASAPVPVPTPRPASAPVPVPTPRPTSAPVPVSTPRPAPTSAPVPTPRSVPAPVLPSTPSRVPPSLPLVDHTYADEPAVPGAPAPHFEQPNIISSHLKIAALLGLISAAGAGVWKLTQGFDLPEFSSSSDDEADALSMDVESNLQKIHSVDPTEESHLRETWNLALGTKDAYKMQQLTAQIKAHANLVPDYERLNADLQLLQKNDFVTLADNYRTDWEQLWGTPLPDLSSADDFISRLESDSSFKRANAETEVATTVDAKLSEDDQKEIKLLDDEWEGAKTLFSLPNNHIADLDKKLETAKKSNDKIAILAAYGNALKTLSELYFKDHDGEVQTWLKDPLLAQQADRFASSWEGARKNRIRDEATVYQTIKNQLETAKLQEENEEAKAKTRAATTVPVQVSSGTEVSQYTSSSWTLDTSLTTCPASWDPNWEASGAVAALVVVCEGGKVKDPCPIYSKPGEKKFRKNTNGNMYNVLTYDVSPIPIPAAACEIRHQEGNPDGVYKIKILKK